MNIAPGDLEKVLDQHPAVNNVMVSICKLNVYLLNQKSNPNSAVNNVMVSMQIRRISLKPKDIILTLP